MRNRKYELMTAPGLPNWPRLFYDRQSRFAYVDARHPTWRSFQWAFAASRILSGIGCLLAFFIVWHYLADLEIVFRIFASLAACCFLFPIVGFTVRHSAVDFLARQVFATRIRFLTSPDLLAFRSRLYKRTVVVWRRWNQQDVRGRFILNQDLDAACFAADSQTASKNPRSHLNEAMILELVVSASDTRNSFATTEQVLRRAIPITEISSRNARKFTTVFTAAVALTAPVSSKSFPSDGGVDIDL